MVAKKPAELVEPKRISDGFVLGVSAQEQNAGFAFFCFGLVWTLGSGAIFINTLKDAMRLGGGFSFVHLFMYFCTAFVSLFVIVGLSILVLAMLELWANYRLQPAELILPQYPLRLGDECRIYYRRKLRKGSFSKAGKVEAQLICDEWVQYTQGTDTVTKTHTLHKQTLPNTTIVSGEHQADYDADITIPVECPPSFYGENNKLRWRLVIKLKAPGIAQICKSVFHLQVLPETVAL